MLSRKMTKFDIESPIFKPENDNSSLNLNITKLEQLKELETDTSEKSGLEKKLKGMAIKNDNFKYILKAKFDNQKFAFLLRNKFLAYNKKNILPQIKLYKEFDCNRKNPFEYFTKRFFYEPKVKNKSPIKKDLILSINKQPLSKNKQNRNSKNRELTLQTTFLTEGDLKLKDKNSQIIKKLFDKTIREEEIYNQLTFIDYKDTLNNSYEEELNEFKKIKNMNKQQFQKKTCELNFISNRNLKKGLTGIFFKGKKLLTHVDSQKSNPYTPYQTGMDIKKNEEEKLTSTINQRRKFGKPSLKENDIHLHRMQKIMINTRKLVRNISHTNKKNAASSNLESLKIDLTKDFWNSKIVEFKEMAKVNSLNKTNMTKQIEKNIIQHQEKLEIGKEFNNLKKTYSNENPKISYSTQSKMTKRSSITENHTKAKIEFNLNKNIFETDNMIRDLDIESTPIKFD